MAAKKRKRKAPIKVMTRKQVMNLVLRSLKKIGVSLADFQKMDCCDRKITLHGCHADMLLTMLEQAK